MTKSLSKSRFCCFKQLSVKSDLLGHTIKYLNKVAHDELCRDIQYMEI